MRLNTKLWFYSRAKRECIIGVVVYTTIITNVYTNTIHTENHELFFKF